MANSDGRYDGTDRRDEQHEVPPPMPVIGEHYPPVEDDRPAPVPVAGAPAQQAPAPVPVAGSTPARSTMLGVFNDAKRTGPWKVPRRLTVGGLFNDVVLDLREAIVTNDEIDLQVLDVFGDVDVIVPPGVHVDLGGGAGILCDTELRGDLRPVPGAWTLRVTTWSVFSDVRVHVREPGQPALDR